MDRIRNTHSCGRRLLFFSGKFCGWDLKYSTNAAPDISKLFLKLREPAGSQSEKRNGADFDRNHNESVSTFEKFTNEFKGLILFEPGYNWSRLQ